MNRFLRPGERLGIKVLLRAARAGLHHVQYARADRRLQLGIIGFPKCGTTALHAALLSGGAFRAVTYESRSCHIVPATQGDDGLTLVKNPNLVYEPWWLSTIDSLVGPAKYIVCLRDPFETLHSFYWYRRRELDQHKSWIPRHARPSVIPTEAEVMTGTAELLGASRLRVCYPRWITGLLHIIPPERLRFLWLEDVATDPMKAQLELDQFVGQSTHLAHHYSVTNRNSTRPSHASPDRRRLYDTDGFFDQITADTNALLTTLARQSK